MTNMGEKLTEEEANEMIACADCDAQGEIDYKGVTHVFCEICISGDDVVYPHSYVDIDDTCFQSRIFSRNF